MWSAKADGSGAQCAAPSIFGADGEPEAGPAWSPLGDRLAFVATLSGSADVYAMAPGGGRHASYPEVCVTVYNAGAPHGRPSVRGVRRSGV